MLLQQIFVTPSKVEKEFQMLNGCCKQGEIFDVYAVDESSQKILIADSQGVLGWFYMHLFRVVQSITRVVQEISSPAQMLTENVPITEERESPIMDLKNNTKGKKNG